MVVNPFVAHFTLVSVAYLLVNARPAPPVTVSTIAYQSAVTDVAVDPGGNLLMMSGAHAMHLVPSTGGAGHVVAGSSVGTSGTSDGIGTAAGFNFPRGIVCDVSSNVAYVSDTYNNWIRKVGLANYNVVTFAGSAVGTADGVGPASQFSSPWGIAHHKYPSYPSVGGVLYVAEQGSARVRKIVIATANVTTVALTATTAWCVCITGNGLFLYVTTTTTVIRIDTLREGAAAVTTIAGGSSTSLADGVGTAARFNTPRGVALNSDESALLIADGFNNRIRRLNLSNNNVSTIAGSSNPHGATWHCNITSNLCGVLVADFGNSALRFVAVELVPLTVSRKDTPSASFTKQPSSSRSDSADTSRTSSDRSWSLNMSPTASASVHLTATRISCITFSASSLSTATETRSPTPSMTQLTHLISLTISQSESVTNCSLCTTTSTSSPSMSYSSSATSSHSQSRTQRSTSPSSTMYCALIPAANGALVALEPLFLDTLRAIAAAADNAIDIIGASPLTPAAATAAATGVQGNAVSNAPRSVVVAAEPINRQTLLQASPFAANVSMTLGGTLRGVNSTLDSWPLVAARLDVLPADAAFPVLTTALRSTTVSSVVTGRRQVLVLVLHTGNATRWLPSTFSNFRVATLQLRLTLQCPTDATVVQDFVVAVPAPGQPVSLATAVKAASTASQYSSSVAGPTAGSAVGRLSGVRGLVTCTGDGSVSALLPLPTGAMCADHSAGAADAGGAVLGNLVLWAGGLALMAVVVGAYALAAHVPLRVAAERLGAPSPLLPLMIVTVPSTAFGTFVLLRSPCAGDTVVAVVGLVMCTCPIAVVCGLVLLLPERLRCVPRERDERPAHFTALARLLRRRVRWLPVSDQAPADAARAHEADRLRLERVATVVVLEYRVVWYLCVDVGVLSAASCLGAVSQLESAAACRMSAAAVALLYGGQLALCATVRPFTTMLSQLHNLVALTLSTLSVCCQVWYLFASAHDDANLDELSPLLTAAAVCDLVVAAGSMLRMLLDGVEVLRACRRHVMMISNVARHGASTNLAVSDAEWSGITDIAAVAMAENEVLLDVELLSDLFVVATTHDVGLVDVEDSANSNCDHFLLGQEQHEECDEERRFWRSDGSAAEMQNEAGLLDGGLENSCSTFLAGFSFLDDMVAMTGVMDDINAVLEDGNSSDCMTTTAPRTLDESMRNPQPEQCPRSQHTSQRPAAYGNTP